MSSILSYCNLRVNAFCNVCANFSDLHGPASATLCPASANKGPHLIQTYAQDLRSPAFRAEARRQSTAVAASADAGDDQAFIDAVSDRDDE